MAVRPHRLSERVESIARFVEQLLIGLHPLQDWNQDRQQLVGGLDGEKTDRPGRITHRRGCAHSWSSETRQAASTCPAQAGVRAGPALLVVWPQSQSALE